MKKNPENTRTDIMNSAQALILENGFGGTTVDAVIERAGVSKGAFFHHFASKAELGLSLVHRYAEEDSVHLEATLDKAEKLSDDPLQQLLIFIKLFEQEVELLDEPFPGCLFASYLYQSELFDENILEIIRQSMLKWRIRIKEKLEEAAEKYPPSPEVHMESLADMLMVIFEGAFVLTQSLEDTQIIARQLGHYHTYVKLLFNPEK